MHHSSRREFLLLGESKFFKFAYGHRFSKIVALEHGIILVIRDTTDVQQRIQRVLYNSTHDSLTGLYTKQYLYECMRKSMDLNPDTD